MASKKMVEIRPPNYQIAEFVIRGTEYYVSNAFSQEAFNVMRAKQAAGAGQPKPPKTAKDFGRAYLGSMHRSSEGWYGLPAAAIQAALVRASKYAGHVMKDAKCCILALRDGFDESNPLIGIIRITGEPEKNEMPARNDNGSCDIRSRGVWAPGWQARIRIRYDADYFSLESVAGLLHRAGMSIGIGAGRPDSKESTGQGWGLFEIVSDASV